MRDLGFCSAPGTVIRAFDTLASVCELNMWKDETKITIREAIERKAGEIILAALHNNTNELPALLEKDGDLAKKYSEMDNLFTNG